MDESQITGAASSYARKYALNGLFLIDDTKDADSHSPEQVSVAYTNEQKATFDKLMAEGNAIKMFLFNKTFYTQDASSPSAMAWTGLINSFEHGTKGKKQTECQELIKNGREQLIDLFNTLRNYIRAMDDAGIAETLEGLTTEETEFLTNQLTAEEAKYLTEVA